MRNTQSRICISQNYKSRLFWDKKVETGFYYPKIPLYGHLTSLLNKLISNFGINKKYRCKHWGMRRNKTGPI